MTTARYLTRRLIGFALLPVIAAISPLLILPFLARLVTVGEWAAIGIGQSVGTIAALMISAGWTVVGPAEVARTKPSERARVLTLAVATRGVLSTVITPLAGIGAAAIAPSGHQWLAAAMAVASSMAGMSMTWFAVGAGAPRQLAAFETAPKVGGNIIGVTLAGSTGQIIWYPTVLAISTAIPPTVHWLLLTNSGSRRVSRTMVMRRLRQNVSSIGTEVIAGAYSAGSTAIIGTTSSAEAVGTFNAGYRLTGMGSVAIATTASTFQAWLAESAGQEFTKRARITFLAHLGIGAFGLAALWGLGPTLTELLFGKDLAVDRVATCPLGVFFLLWSIETFTGRHVLATRGRTRSLAMSTALGSAIGLTAVATGGQQWGAPGAAWGLVTGMAAIVVLQIRPVIRTLQVEAAT